MAVETRYDEGNDIYELGDTIDGAFVAFAQVEGGHVRGRVANQQQQPEQQQTDQPTQQQPAGEMQSNAATAQ